MNQFVINDEIKSLDLQKKSIMLLFLITNLGIWPFFVLLPLWINLNKNHQFEHDRFSNLNLIIPTLFYTCLHPSSLKALLLGYHFSILFRLPKSLNFLLLEQKNVYLLVVQLIFKHASFSVCVCVYQVFHYIYK